MTEVSNASEQYLELTRLADLKMMNRVWARRATANALFLTVSTALLAFVSSGSLNVFWLVALAVIALSGTWWALLQNYRDLEAAKFKVITVLERHLQVQSFLATSVQS